jgi:hypothetical protein
MKKMFSIIVFFTCLSVYSSYSEDFGDYIAIESAPYYSWGEQMGVLEKDEKVNLEGTIVYGQIEPGESHSANVVFMKDNKRYMTYLDKISPLESENFFSEEILTDSNSIYKNLFLPSFYWNIVGAGDREKIFDYEPGLLKSYFNGERDVDWFENYTTQRGENRFFNAAVQIKMDIFLVIKNIRKIPNGYIINFTNSILNKRYIDMDNASGILGYNLSYLINDEPLVLYVIFDGDYLDLYVDNVSQKLTTLVRADEEFVTQFNQLIKINSCDLSNVQWPRRADGSMDYPPPELQSSTTQEQITPAVQTQDAATAEPEGTEMENTGPEAIEQPAAGFPVTLVFAVAGTAIAVGLVIVFMLRWKR